MLKPIKDYEGLYSITPDGRIWSHEKIRYNGSPSGHKLKDRWLNPYLDKNGYLVISLYKNKKLKKKFVHQLVATTYIPNPKNRMQINHLNGIKNDNRVENIEWCTSKENHAHGRKMGLFVNVDNSGENNGNSKLTWEQVYELRANHVSEGIMKRKPWKKYGIDSSLYYKIKNNKRWKVQH